jgi:hypothetical protein
VQPSGSAGSSLSICLTSSKSLVSSAKIQTFSPG